MTITAKFNSRCSSPTCRLGGVITAGQSIEWRRGQRPVHAECQQEREAQVDAAYAERVRLARAATTSLVERRCANYAACGHALLPGEARLCRECDGLENERPRTSPSLVPTYGYENGQPATSPLSPPEGMLPSIDAIRSAPAIPAGAKFVAVDDASVAGALFGWSGEGQVTREALSQTFLAAFGRTMTAEAIEALLPAAPELEAVLKRALGRTKHNTAGRLMVRPVERGEEWAVVQETKVPVEGSPRKHTLSHRTLVRAALVKTSQDQDGVLALPGTEIRFDDAVDGVDWLFTAVRADFVASRDNLSAADVSGWVAETLRRRYRAVQVHKGMRQYFVPAEEAAGARAFVAAVEAATRHEFSDIPAMRAESAIKAFLRALERETLEAASAIEAQVEAQVEALAKLDAEDGAGAITRRTNTLRKRVEAASDLRQKLDKYAEMFGRPAEAAANVVERLKRNILLGVEFAVAKADGRAVDAPRLLDLSDGSSIPSEPGTSPGAEARIAAIAAEPMTFIVNDQPCGRSTPSREAIEAGRLFPTGTCCLLEGHVGPHRA